MEQKRGVTLVPTAAIQRTTSTTYVYLVKPDPPSPSGKSRRESPKASDTEITSGVAPGDVVVMTGVDKLQEGSKVNVQFADAQQALPAQSPAVSPEARRK